MQNDINELPKGDTKWFQKARFGLFIHWGLYATPARHEWVKSREQIPEADYHSYFKTFNPDRFDPAKWAEAARAAGMKYFVVTTKHHDGFCLWDSAQTDYKAPNTPARRDLLREMVDAFRARDFRTGFYHSLIDWHHPEYVIDSINHPLRAHPDRAAMNAKRDQSKYAAYLREQVRELLTNYGQVDVLWFDFSFPHAGPDGKGRKDWESEKLYRLVRELAPGVILNDRIDLPGTGDVHTPEQFQPPAPVTRDGKPVVWEACQTFSGSWGYHRDESTWKSTDLLIRMLIDTVSKDGNLLLNVGPNARGEFDPRAMERLRGMARWMDLHHDSIHDCRAAPAEFTPPTDARLTWNPDRNRLYLHLFAWPFRFVHLKGQAYLDRIEFARFLNDGSEVRLHRPEPAKRRKVSHTNLASQVSDDTLLLELPVQQPDPDVTVVELILRDQP